jgi:hypothetical protein
MGYRAMNQADNRPLSFVSPRDSVRLSGGGTDSPKLRVLKWRQLGRLVKQGLLRAKLGNPQQNRT